MSEILIINFAKGASRTGSVSHTGCWISKFGELRDSEENGDFQKKVKGIFGEKRV